MTGPDAQPMPFVRLEAGLYEALGTSHHCLIRKALVGWELIVDGVTLEALFESKRQALSYCQSDPSI